MTRSLFVLALLLPISAAAVEVDRGPSGTAVTLRPEPDKGERIEITVNGIAIALPADLEAQRPWWLIAPEAYREAVARVEELTPYQKLATERADIITGLETELRTEKAARSTIRLELAGEQVRVVEIKKQRVQWAVGGIVIGLVTGIAGSVVLATSI